MLQAAIEEKYGKWDPNGSGLMGGEGVEDLSMRSYNNSNVSSPIKSDSPSRYADVYVDRHCCCRASLYTVKSACKVPVYIRNPVIRNFRL